jgi:hypothetical protein
LVLNIDDGGDNVWTNWLNSRDPINQDWINEDWIKTRTWGWPHIQTLDDFLSSRGGRATTPEHKAKQEEDVLDFLTLPSSIPMPEGLRRELNDYFGKKLPNSHFIGKLRQIGYLVERHFVEDEQNFNLMASTAMEVDATFPSDLSSANQEFFWDILQRPNPDSSLWLQSAWKRLGMTTVDDALRQLRLDGLSPDEQVAKLGEFMNSEKGVTAPDSFRRVISDFVGHRLPNPRLDYRLSRAIKVRDFAFPDKVHEHRELEAEIRKIQPAYFSDLPKEIRNKITQIDYGFWKRVWWEEDDVDSDKGSV